MQTAHEKRSLIQRHKKTLSCSRAAIALGMSRTTRTSKEKDDDVWKERMLDVLLNFPTYGYRRMTKALVREGHPINHKKTKRLMKSFGFTQKKRRVFKPRTTDSRHTTHTFPNLVSTIVPAFPYHVVAGDITYVRLGKGFCYVAILIDLFTRRIVGYAIARSMNEQMVRDALEMALQKGIPQYHHSDRGSQYGAHEYVNRLRSLGVQISMADVGMSVDNPYAESFNRTLKVEEVYLRAYETFDEARASISAFIDDVYNTTRLHSSIGYVPPCEFEAQWRNEHLHKTAQPVSLVHYQELSI